MSEPISPSVKRATEILGGGNSWNLNDLIQLEKALNAEDEKKLASDIQFVRRKKLVDDANKILSGPAEKELPKDRLAEMLALSKQLAGFKDFSLARRLLKHARIGLEKDPNKKVNIKDEDRPSQQLEDEIYQKSALYTYKDEDLPREWKLDRAFKFLDERFKFTETENQETLGLAGGIFKRKWETDRLRQNLDRSLFYYLRGYAIGIEERHVADSVKKRLSPDADPLEVSATLKVALKEARANVFDFLRANPDCTLSVETDKGYCGINAAFMLDLLARESEQEAERAGLVSVAASERREAARLIREEITRSVSPLWDAGKGDWWLCATLGEAYFGLADYDKAIEWLVTKPKDAGMEVPEWEYESSARQLARLARLQCDAAITEEGFEKSDAGKALKKFLGGDEKAVRSTFRGKFGLGLSGGGFRASLFHIGVLARLAELDVLRHVEVLSCVSGGSIIGAHYYLEVRKLLETKTDDEITREDYIELVKRVEAGFLEGVQRNIRTRVLAEWVTNLKMIFWSGYTRTLRVGELYERELFSRVEDFEEKDDNNRTKFGSPVTGPKWLPDWIARRVNLRREKRWLNALYIHPMLPGGNKQADFKPRSHNWRRKNKAPDLILNAASLNTGHNWQFTASYMGEPPVPINADIDSNYRLRRMYYDNAPEKFKTMRLGHAVAASSCVPGLFEPLILDGLYPEDPEEKIKDDKQISVRLVDGGVCDNQGVASLLEQDCTVMLVSDASGQMEAQNVPGGGPLGVLLRTTSVVQARVRDAQYTDISSRQRSSQLLGLMFIHLRQDLPGGNVTWKECPWWLRKSDFDSGQDGASDTTSFGVSAKVQRKLAAVRTDLDSFSDAEAFALMTSAYRMTEKHFGKCVEGFKAPAQTERWRFLEIESAMQPLGTNSKSEGRKRLERLLDAGSSLAFKIWKLSLPLIILKWTLLVALAAGIVWLFYDLWDASVVPPAAYAWLRENVKFQHVAWFFIWIAVFAFIAAGVNAIVGKKYGKNIMQVIRWRDTLKSIVVGIGMSTLGFIGARIHLHIFDRFYLRYGKLKKFSK